MSIMIIGALAPTLFQLWLLPASLNLNNLEYRLSSRDDPPLLSRLQQRITRAGT